MGDDQAKVSQATEATRELRRRALAAPGHGRAATTLNADTLQRVARTFAKGTSIGADAQAFHEVADATHEARDELAEIMRTSIRELVWPVQSLLVLMGLLGKKAGGTRTIAIIATFGRLPLAAVKGEVRAWDEKVANPHDTALKGRRPADETARRHMRVEVATLLGKHSVLILWDMKAFFDSLDASILVEAAEDALFPMDQLALGLMMHRAPRMLRVQGSHGSCLARTGRSVLAGCTLSTSLARAYLRPLTLTCRSDDFCTLNQHVDDLTQSVIAPTRHLAIARAIAKGRQLAEEARKLKLEIADKSRVVASTPTAAAAVAAGIRGAGVPILAAEHAEDLGVSTSAGRRRTIGSFARRIAKAGRRARRVGRLTAACTNAKKLYRTGVDPQQSYEGAILGVAPPQIRAMRLNAVQCVTKAGSHPCVATLIAWRLGPDTDPAAREPLRQVQMWMRLWNTTPTEEKGAIRKAWRRALPKVLLKGVQWGRVSGPLHATIATLGQMGWAPIQPDKWLVEDRSTYADLSEQAPEAASQILQTIRASAMDAVWRGAASHWLGKGLELGTPSFAAARAARKWLIKHHQAAEVRALDTILCGGAWCGGRAQLKRRCRCGREETPWHRYWSCDKLEEICDQGGRPIVKETQWMARELQDHFPQYECLWGRAITPFPLCDPGPRLGMELAKGITTPGFSSALKEVKAAYSDGSGGPKHAPAGAPAAGSGVAVIQWGPDSSAPSVERIEVAAAPVPGRQTVPRAELWAACVMSEHADPSKPAHLLSDAAYIVNTVNDKGRQTRARCGANGDLWSSWAKLDGSRSEPVHVTKVAAHASPVQVLNGSRCFADYIGNHIADAAAGAAAERALEENEHARLVERWEARTFLIARRLAAIEVWHWQNDPEHLYEPPAPLPPWTPPDAASIRCSIKDRVTHNGHILQKEGTKVICRRCHRRRATRNHAYWMSTICVPVSHGPIASAAPRRPRPQGCASIPSQPEATSCLDRGGDHVQLHDIGANFIGEGQAAGEMQGDGKRRRVGQSTHDSLMKVEGEGDQMDFGGANGDIPGAHVHYHGVSSPDGVDGGYHLGHEGVTGERYVGEFRQGVNGHYGEVRGGYGGNGTYVTGSVGSKDGFHLHPLEKDTEPTYLNTLEEHPSSHTATVQHEDNVNPLAQATSARASSSNDALQPERQAKRICTRAVLAGEQRADDPQLQEAQAVVLVFTDAMDEEITDEQDDPFGFAGLNFDEGQAPAHRDVLGPAARVADDPPPQPPQPLAASGQSIEGHASASSEGNLLTARDRRRMVLEQAAERNKRRRIETDAIAKAWDGGEAAVTVGDYVSLSTTPLAPPFAVHPSHSLVLCGGFTGCVRCGRVVAYQCHDRFNGECRGRCPTGSQRPIRRLVKGLFPHDVRSSHATPPWPDGGNSPTPRRWRPQ